MNKTYFPYGQVELDYLCAADKCLAKVIRSVGKIEREINSDVFEALISSIIGQQISGKVAAIVKQRLSQKVNGCITPQNISSLSWEELKNCGLSGQKVRYISAAATTAIEGKIDFEGLKNLSDEDVISKLTALSGVGRWTAEMLLIFSLCRPNIISYADFGIRKGMQILYHLDTIDKNTFQRLTIPYHPYATVASFYLWYVANNNWQP